MGKSQVKPELEIVLVGRCDAAVGGVSVFREATSRLEVVKTRKLAAGPVSASGTVLVRRSRAQGVPAGAPRAAARPAVLVPCPEDPSDRSSKETLRVACRGVSLDSDSGSGALRY